MTDDEIVTLGSFCETLMGSDAWAGSWVSSRNKSFMMTKPNELKAREGVHAVQDFLAHMLALVEQTDKPAARPMLVALCIEGFKAQGRQRAKVPNR